MEDYNGILISIRRIMRAVDLHSKRLTKNSGLTVPQLLVMLSIHRQGKVSVSAIASDVHLSQATVTSVLDRLVRAGFVRRERSEGDKRIVYAILTPQGLDKLAQAPEPIQSGFLREFRKLESWERHMLLSSIERIARMMDAEDLDASPILEVGELPGKIEPPAEE